ncbi:hypothetical protein Tco_1040491 [Tanacetum coccineum]
MCGESTANQQTLAEYGTEGRPSILEKGSYVQWASWFLRFPDNKREEGALMRNLIDNGPFKRKDIDDPNNARKKILKPSGRHSRLINEFDQVAAEAGESLTSVYERFSTHVNNMDRNKVKPREIAINTKFLNFIIFNHR